MRIGDYIIQLWRMRVAARWIPEGSRVLDIGCHQGEFLRFLGRRIVPSVGIDPLFRDNPDSTTHLFMRSEFQKGLPFDDGSFDAVVLLATIEHMQQKPDVAREAGRLLRKGGRVIVTVPSLLVDKLLSILLRLRLVDGMSLEEHHGFSPDDLPGIFLPEGFNLKKGQKFQFGLNNLFVFERL
jgi:SAM-dependent methyltransferase